MMRRQMENAENFSTGPRPPTRPAAAHPSGRRAPVRSPRTRPVAALPSGRRAPVLLHAGFPRRHSVSQNRDGNSSAYLFAERNIVL
jgi:hypothetical protein